MSFLKRISGRSKARKTPDFLEWQNPCKAGEGGVNLYPDLPYTAVLQHHFCIRKGKKEGKIEKTSFNTSKENIRFQFQVSY